MAPRFDSDNLRLELAVADLIDSSLLRHIGFGQRGGYERMWVGQAIHSRYQEEAQREDPSYRAEVPIRVCLEHRGWEVVIRGRIDGLRLEAIGDLPEDERTILEEIKSVRRGSELAEAKREIYTRQALLYAWMLSLGEGGAQTEAGDASGAGSVPGQIPSEQIGAELVLIEIGSHEVRREPLEIDFEAIAASVERRLNRLIGDHERDREVASERREAGERLTFPYPELRKGQQDIIAAAATALEQQEHLLMEAPTGLGKTVAALYPALKYALEHQKRVFVLTAKTLQQDMATAVLELLNQDGSFRSLRLRAKSKMCANEEVICHEEFCPYAKDYYLKLHRSRIIDDLLLRYETLQPDSIFAHARQEEVCPFEVSLELSGKAQVVVCDYNYAFDPYVALQEFGQENDLQDTVLVVDEIHNLVDRGRGYYSPRLSTRKALAAAEFLESISHGTPRRAAQVCQELAAWIADTTDHVLADTGSQTGAPSSAGSPGSETQAAETRFVEDDVWDLRPGFDDTFVDYVEYQRETSTYRAEDPFVDLYFDFLRFLDGLAFARTDAFSQYVRRDGDSRSVNILCKDPSRFIGGVINRTHSTIGLSATLSPTDFYRDLLGFDPERTAVTSVASPFPSENRCFAIDDSISTLWRERDRNYQPIANSLSRLAHAVPGNCLALFPSYAFIGHVAPKLEVSGKRILVQGRDDSDQTRNEILDLLRSPIAGDNLLLAVAGGVFAEGVDYPGDILRAVAIIGPCLPAVTLERELLKLYYQERFERGFEYAFVVPGMTRVVQAAGRLIRSAEDTGVIALLDQRFLKTPYRAHLPEDWYDGGRLEDLIAIPGEAATRFFADLQPQA